MKKIVQKLVNWFNKTFRKPKFMRANDNFNTLKQVLDIQLLEFERFLRGDYVVNQPSSRTYMEIVKGFKKVDERSGFEFLIHERKFMVFGNYEDLVRQGRLILSTFEATPNPENYPNLKLTKLDSLDIELDKVGNVFKGNYPLSSFPLEYFSALIGEMYPNQ